VRRAPLGTIGGVVPLAGLLAWPGAALAQGPQRVPAATTSHFAFYTDPAVNLNDALIAAGLARPKGQPELFRSGAEATCFAGLSPAARAGWDRAVDYYAEVVSPGSFGDAPQRPIRIDLAGFDAATKSAADREFIEIARGIREAAAPAYRACRWEAQDARNRRWLDDLLPRLAAHEEAIAGRLEALYRKRWSGVPIPVDVVETVDWSGANTVIRYPEGGHILVSASIAGSAALETVFHEASHLLMDRGDPVRMALDQAATDLGRRLPEDLWHVVLFVTTGEAVRRVLESAGEAGYTPMIEEIFPRNRRWSAYRHAIESTWPAYLEGKRDLPDAAADLVRALPEAAKP
jgi:hypothetical protein